MKGSLERLGVALGCGERWAAWLLGSLGVPIDEQGRFDALAAKDALERLALGQRGLSDVASMGHDEEGARVHLIERLEGRGMAVVARDYRRRSRLTVKRRTDGKTLLMQTYVAMSLRGGGRAVFTVGHLREPEIRWFALIVRPMGVVLHT